jgi:hypothetical protein
MSGTTQAANDATMVEEELFQLAGSREIGAHHIHIVLVTRRVRWYRGTGVGLDRMPSIGVMAL